MKFIELHQFGKRVLFNCENILYIEDKGQTVFLCMGYVKGDPMYEEVEETYNQVIAELVRIQQS